MKKVFKITGLVVLLLLVFVILSPFLFKGKILKLAKSEISNYVDAKVDFSDLDLTIFKSFPSFTISVSDISVLGIGRFEGDTLALIKIFM
ncbi:MAG: hypothetical protein IPO21_04520 [Bacteroidales bacterium]|nr:hypothetical protein [Bacteroidales bacterium]